MTFLNPGLLWFMAGGAIPIIIHLLYRQRYRIVHWAAMEFLLAAIKRTQKRLRLENLILLLIRFLILILLALAVSQPLLRQSGLLAGTDQDTHYILVLDNSYSMRYQAADKSHWSRAVEAAEALLDQLPNLNERDRISIVTMSARPEVVIPGGNRLEQIRETLLEMQPADAAGSVLDSLEQIRRQQTEGTPSDMVCKIYFFTDLQRNAWITPSEREAERAAGLLRDISRAENTQVFLLDVAGRPMENYAIVDVRARAGLATTREALEIGVELYNFSTRSVPDLPILLEVDGTPVPVRNVTLSPSGRATVEFRHQFNEPGPHVVTARVDPPDYLGVDDRRDLAVDVRETVRVLGIDGSPGVRRLDGELGFYRIALDPEERGRFTVIVQPRLLFAGEDLSRYDVLVLANVDTLPDDLVAQIEEFVRAGGGLWIVLGDQVDPDSYNELLWRDGRGLLPGRLEATFGDGTDETRIHLAQIRESHPIFSRFNNEMFTALRSVTFTRAWRMMADAEWIEEQCETGEAAEILSGYSMTAPPAGTPRARLRVERRPESPLWRLTAFRGDEEIASATVDGEDGGAEATLQGETFALSVRLDRARAAALMPSAGAALEVDLDFTGSFPGSGASTVLASFDDGVTSPAIIENSNPSRVGDGRVLVTAFPIDDDWNVFFPTRAIYGAFVYVTSGWLAARPEAMRNYFVGDRISLRLPIERFSQQFSVQLTRRDGTQQSMSLYPEEPGERDRFFALFYPSAPTENGGDGRGLEEFGVYRLIRGEEGDDETMAIFTCNPSPRRPTSEEILASESNLMRLEPEELRALYPDFLVEFVQRAGAERERADLKPEGSNLWRPMLWAVFGLLFLESMLAMLFGQRKQ